MTRLLIGSEKDLLQTFLDQQREVMLWKVEGLSDDQLRRPVTATGMHLLGLVKHLAGVEQYWLCHLFHREVELPFSQAAADDLELEPGDTAEGVLAYYGRARRASDEAIAELDLDATATTWVGDTVSFRWTLLHVIEEAARHAGHADIIREHIDNTTGYLPNGAPY